MLSTNASKFIQGIFIGAKDDAAYLLPKTSIFLRYISIAAIGQIVLGILPTIIQIDNGQKIVIFSGIFALVVSITGYFLNFLYFNGGLIGLSYIYCITSYSTLFVLLLHFFSKKSMLDIKPGKISIKTLIKIFKISTPDTMLNILKAFRYFHYVSIR